MSDAIEIPLTLAALVVGPYLILTGLARAVNAIYFHVVPRLLIAPASYPARAVAWLMLAGFAGIGAGIVGAVAYWL